MEQYISKSALVAEIENWKQYTLECGYKGQGDYEDGNKQGRLDTCDKFLSFIETIEVKKVEEMYERPTIKIEDDISVISRLQHIDADLKPIADFIIDYASWNLHKEEWNHPVLEVPLFRVLDALVQRGKPYCGG